MNHRLSVLMYCQHLSGTGHFVRSYEIGRALAGRHDVWLVDGGRPVPRSAAGVVPKLLPLPRIYQQDGVIRSVDEGTAVRDIMVRRLAVLRDFVSRLRPDVLMVEHFPFSKWLLADEITALVEHARTCSPDLRVICSVRDIMAPSRFDAAPEAHRDRVLATLGSMFDGVLVHSDPSFSRIEEHLPWAARIGVPAVYTGFVSERPPPRAAAAPTDPYVVVSTGGAGDGSLLLRCAEAWRELVRSERHGARRLIVFVPPFSDRWRKGDVASLLSGPLVEVRSFDSDFLDIMHGADLSISHAGYNTCMNILACRVRAIVVPNPAMTDQLIRAQLFADLGILRTVDPTRCTAQLLADAMAAALGDEPPRHDLDLEGAARTRELVETILANGGPFRFDDDRQVAPAGSSGNAHTAGT
jgi:predicted glycosyltransferase